MPDLSHEYERSVVIRVRYRASGDGLESFVVVDTDIQDWDATLGVVERAKQLILNGGGVQHDYLPIERLDDALGVITFEQIDEAMREGDD